MITTTSKRKNKGVELADWALGGKLPVTEVDLVKVEAQFLPFVYTLSRGSPLSNPNETNPLVDDGCKIGDTHKESDLLLAKII